MLLKLDPAAAPKKCVTSKELVDEKLNIPDHSILETNGGIRGTGCSDTRGRSRSTACGDFRQLQLSRRDTLRAGVLSLTGLGLPRLLRAQAVGQSSGPNGFGRAKSCILIFMWGGPSQLDTWDPKPDAPDAIRGPFRPIATNVPGTSISEHFPLLAQQAHRLAIVRSMNHDDAAHLSTAHRLLTGHLAPTPNSDAAGPSPQRLAAPGGHRLQASADPGRDPERRQHALDGHAPRRPRRPGARPGRRLAGQGVRPVPRRGRPQRLGLPRRGPRSARRDLAGTLDRSPASAQNNSPKRPTCPATDRNRGTAISRKRSTASSRPRRAGPSRSIGKARGSATAMGGTSTVSASCWRVG